MPDKLQDDEDYILLKRFDYSVKAALERYPEGLPDHLVAQALGLEEDEIIELYESVVVILRGTMKVENE